MSLVSSESDGAGIGRHLQLMNQLLGSERNTAPYPEVVAAQGRLDENRFVSLMSIGEGWGGIANELAAALVRVHHRELHGYGLHPAGHPRLVSAASAFTTMRYELPCTLAQAGIDVAISTSGTRAVMQDFGDLILRKHAPQATPGVMTTSPDWGYADLFSPLGYAAVKVRLDPHDGFQPHLGRFETAYADAVTRGVKPVLIVLCSHHNPTGRVWTRDEIIELTSFAARRQMFILVDEAHAFSSELRRETTATSDVLFTLRNLGMGEGMWLSVQSYGKLFDCNGWGIGQYLGPSAIVNPLLFERRFSRYYTSVCFLQEALAYLLENKADCDIAIDGKAVRLAKRRRLFYDTMEECGYGSPRCLHALCGPFALIAFDLSISEAKVALTQIASQTGVVLSAVGVFPGPKSSPARCRVLLRAFVDIDGDRMTRSVEFLTDFARQKGWIRVSEDMLSPEFS